MIEIKSLPLFDKAIKHLSKRYKSLGKDLRNLREELQANPHAGIDLGRGLHKVRMAISDKGKGKSHGARVITYTEAIISVNEGSLTLLYIYDKAERENISDKELQELLKLMKE